MHEEQKGVLHDGMSERQSTPGGGGFPLPGLPLARDLMFLQQFRLPIWAEYNSYKAIEAKLRCCKDVKR
eukprot:5609940-Amphidinium_carterae.1